MLLLMNNEIYKIQQIPVTNIPNDFFIWLDSIRKKGYGYEVHILKGILDRVEVYRPDDGDWSSIEFGRIRGNQFTASTTTIYKPALINGIFIEDVSVKNLQKVVRGSDSNETLRN